MKRRFKNIFNLQKKRKGFVLVIAIFIIIVSIGGFMIFKTSEVENSNEREIDPEQLPASILTEDPASENETIQSEYSVIENHLNNVYEGIAGSFNIRMMIHRKDNELKAYYVMKTDGYEKVLNGTYDSNNETFYLSDSDETVSFSGKVKANTDEGDLLIGTCSFDGNSSILDFSIAHVYAIGDSENRNEIYEYLGYNTAEVESFVEMLKQYISNDEKENLAKVIAYPIGVNLNGTHIVLNNEEEFIQNYNDIFDQHFKNKILSDYYKYLWANYMGISFANGSIWFYSNSEDKSLKINAISNGSQPLPDGWGERGITQG